MDMTPVSFESLFSAYAWKPIRGCPGRYVLTAGAGCPPIEELAGGRLIERHRVAAVRDAVLVVALENGGGLISYARDDGTCVHTLNTLEGLARKLAQLGIGAGGADRAVREPDGVPGG